MQAILFSPKELLKKSIKDPSAYVLIASNLLTLILAIVYNWDVIIILWGYWSQSVIIGLFNVAKLLSFKNFSVKELKVNNQAVTAATTGIKLFLAGFFAFHYGFFHFVYALFLSDFGSFGASTTTIASSGLLIMVGIFFLNHLFSFVYNYKKDSKKMQNIENVFFAPYARIIPMHLTIIFGGLMFMLGAHLVTLLIFIGVKTMADLAMHVAEHENDLTRQIFTRQN